MGKVFERIKRTVAAALSIAVAAGSSVCLCSCFKSNQDRITEIYFVACTTSGTEPFYKNENYRSNETANLQMKEALELVHEVEAIPDPVSTDGANSYIIQINYVEDGVEKHVEKTGYNTFPDNWDRVIELTNTIAGYQFFSDNREVAVIDSDYIDEHFDSVWIANMIPDDMTLDEIIEAAPITYVTIYGGPGWPEDNLNNAINNYLYSYFDLWSHQIEELDKNPAESSKDELYEFADSRLHKVDWDNTTDYSCTGTYKGVTYEIVRYDMVQIWLDNQPETLDLGRNYPQLVEEYCFTGNPLQFDIVLPPKEAFMSKGHIYKNVFVDGSGKFLIITESDKPGEIADVVK